MPTDIGQRVFKVFTLVDSGQTSALPAFCDDGKFDCDFKIPVYANGGTDDLQNDKSSVLAMSQDWVTAAVFTIQKYIGAVWVDQDTITDDTYGEYFAMGDFEDKPKYSGVILYWKNVLADLGVGEYRIKLEETVPIGTNTTYTRSFCLKECICTPDNTVRLEWYNNKGLGNIDRDREILDFDNLNWYSQVRLPSSFFGYPVSTYETEEIQYNNGEFQDISKDQEEKYQLITGPLPAWLHNTLKTLACQSGGQLFITDYSNNNPQEIVRKQVKLTSGYEPRWKKTNKCAPVTLEFKPSFNRLEMYRCL